MGPFFISMGARSLMRGDHMSNESKMVKYASLLALAVGMITIAGFAYAVATGADLFDSLFVLAVAVDAVVYGFKGARVANVPSEIPPFKKEVAWAPLLGIAVVADFSLIDPIQNTVLCVVAYASFIALVVIDVVVMVAAKKIEQA